MKRNLLLSVALIISIVTTSFGQWGSWEINFEDTTTLSRVLIDTVSNPNNIWQIGHPNKVIFNSEISIPNVIVTDTVNPYPSNDTSSFTIIHLASAGWALAYPKVDIGGWYFVDCDTLTDYGYIDFSPDHGNTWYRADSSEGFCTWGATEELPIFTGFSNGWKHFYYCLQVPYPVNEGDTILYRFTFISDSVQTNKDGLMFDDLHFEDWAEGIQEVQNGNLFSLSPNPVQNLLTINFHSLSPDFSGTIAVYDVAGRKIVLPITFIADSYGTNNKAELTTTTLSNGIYLLQIINTKTGMSEVGKFVKEE
ncbi:MAG TPA: T9SS type A sorting domain-containing protein [Chitinophagales bacterium]|nr:T9SS type A sorting domain-containing protein [Chitinophagales bacterium]